LVSDFFFIFLLFKAIDSRDALAKSLYASLFEWLVEQINKSLEVGKRRIGRSISILDIYGFESFDVSFMIVVEIIYYIGYNLDEELYDFTEK